MHIAKTAPDYTARAYWNGLIKMGLSKFFILCALERRGMHGYEIARTVETITSGCCAPSEGALYPVLHEFQAGGYVTVESQIVNGRARKVYELTDKGREAWRVAAAAWRDVSGCLAGSCAPRKTRTKSTCGPC